MGNPFWSKNKGFVAVDADFSNKHHAWVKASNFGKAIEQIEIGEILFDDKLNEVVVQDIEHILEQDIKTYDVSIGDTHVFFADSILTHNTPAIGGLGGGITGQVDITGVGKVLGYRDILAGVVGMVKGDSHTINKLVGVYASCTGSHIYNNQSNGYVANTGANWHQWGFYTPDNSYVGGQFASGMHGIASSPAICLSPDPGDYYRRFGQTGGIDRNTGWYSPAEDTWAFTAGGIGRIKINTTGIHPVTSSAVDLGTTALRWRNVYTTDLQLSNMDKKEGNDVDGTKGDWTLQEGEDNLFVINNLSGKKYRIALIPEEE